MCQLRVCPDCKPFPDPKTKTNQGKEKLGKNGMSSVLVTNEERSEKSRSLHISF